MLLQRAATTESYSSSSGETETKLAPSSPLTSVCCRNSGSDEFLHVRVLQLNHRPCLSSFNRFDPAPMGPTSLAFPYKEKDLVSDSNSFSRFGPNEPRSEPPGLVLS
ncbi:hypothetical protein MRB53_007070 [Persea americana]|uniref:Uncharacterized protein n=1 Tax=Persea americana TaxID=3435 RepID=A0ACC2MHY5_PERAE|nr:hypothetical protein MRB53_007070 [Persea americana]